LRAFLHGRIDLSQAEAVADLIASANKSQHDMALQQMKGGLSNEIKSLREQLLNFASLIELELDFGEEDVEFADRLQLQTLIEKIIHHINPILESFHLGNAIKNGIPTAIIGRPNAGKSSLLNVLLNDERAIVTEIAGTTRDTIEEQFIIKGISFRLIDTAGMRESDDLVEKMGIQKTYEKIGEAQMILYVYDVNLLSVAEVLADIQPLLKEGQRVIICANKSDALKASFPTSFVDEFQQQLAEHFAAFVLMSTKSKTNIELLKNELVKDYVSIVTQHHVILTNTRHVDALATAKESLEAVLLGVHSHTTGDFLSLDIKRSLNALAEISGEVTNDEVLGNIFSKFCIGK
jgi:tRNA modification GTPase